jgi:hypothetical protein
MLGIAARRVDIGRVLILLASGVTGCDVEFTGREKTWVEGGTGGVALKQRKTEAAKGMCLVPQSSAK